MHVLGNQQKQAYDKIIQWLHNGGKRFVLSGYAGTGKTTLAKELANNYSFQFLAYTGKATNVLREKGCSPANTIHSMVYKLHSEHKGEPQFVFNSKSELKNKKVIVDEYSMLSEELICDIESLASKVLYLGDNFQLPPVNGVNILSPDFQLTEIHRQALESNIVCLSADVREGKGIPFCNLPDFIHCRKNELPRDVFLSADQILVGRNQTRRDWIKRYRQHQGITELLPTAGEKVICLKNNHEIGLFNGMMETIEKVMHYDAGKQLFHMKLSDGKEVACWDGDFFGKDPQAIPSFKMNRFDFGCVITTHKSQGSEWDTVVVANEPIGRSQIDMSKWLYTALTRARKKVYLVS